MKQEERKQVIKEIILWCKSGKQDVDNGVDEIDLLIDQQNKELQKELKRVTKKASVMEHDNFKLIAKLEEANKEVERLKEYVGFYEYCKEEEPFVVDRFVDSLKDTLNK